MVDDMEIAIRAAKQCLLPTLKIKLGDQHVGPELFGEFQIVLSNNLRLFIDIFNQKQTDWLSSDITTIEFRKYFCLVLCEQAQPSIFQVEDKNLQHEVILLWHDNFPSIFKDTKLIETMIKWYEKCLINESWSFNLGAIHGFVQFSNECFKLHALNNERANLLLSIGLKLLDHFEPYIQLYGLKLINVIFNEKVGKFLKDIKTIININIFIILLISQNLRLSKLLNLHKVVTKEVMKLTAKSNNAEFIENVWKLLYFCNNETQSCSQWTVLDDIIEELLARLGLENSKNITVIYLFYLNKFLMIHKQTEAFEISVIETIVNDALTHDSFTPIQTWLENLKYCESNQISFRWLKKISIVIQNECFKLGGDIKVLLVHIQVGLLKYSGVTCIAYSVYKHCTV